MSKPAQRTFLAATTLVLFLSLSPSSAQSLFKWIDGEGLVNYGQTPPAGQPVQTLKGAAPPADLGPPPRARADAGTESVPTPPATVPDPAEQERRRAEAERARAESCRKLRLQLETLTAPGGRRISLKEPGGNRVIGEDERQELIARTRSQLDEHCGD